MAEDLGALVYDTVLADVAAIRIRDGIEAVLTRELSLLGLDAVFEDSFAAIVLRISSTMQTGTAYVELRQGDARMRIILHPTSQLMPNRRDSA